MSDNQYNLSPIEYQTIVEQAPIMIWRAGTDALCNYFNERWLAFSGRSMEEESGNGWANRVHPDDFNECLKIYLDAFGRREIFEMEYRLMRHDGLYRWIFDRGVPIYGSAGEFIGYAGSCIDVSERVEAEERYRTLQKKEISKLQALIPICASCKNIRNDDGYWQQVEVYFSEHSEASFTHGICPVCEARVMKELEQ